MSSVYPWAVRRVVALMGADSVIKVSLENGLADSWVGERAAGVGFRDYGGFILLFMLWFKMRLTLSLRSSTILFNGAPRLDPDGIDERVGAPMRLCRCLSAKRCTTTGIESDDNCFSSLLARWCSGVGGWDSPRIAVFGRNREAITTRRVRNEDMAGL
jgi:hypothetical protein